MTRGPLEPGRDADADLPVAPGEGWAARWEARLAAIAEALERPLAGPGRTALQAELEAVQREADAMSAAAAHLRDRAAELARRWQATPLAVAAVTPVRVDHLGASTFLEKGWSWLARGDAAAAEEAFRHALTLAPGSAEGEVLLAWALGHGGSTAEARPLLVGVLSRVPPPAPPHALALATLGFVALRDGDLDGAEALLRRAVSAGGDRKASLYAWFHLGVVARRRGALDAAEAAFSEALRQGPNLLQAWYERGRARWEAGQTGDAVAAWRAGAAAGKFNPWGRQCSELVDRVEAGEAPRFVDT